MPKAYLAYRVLTKRSMSNKTLKMQKMFFIFSVFIDFGSICATESQVYKAYKKSIKIFKSL